MSSDQIPYSDENQLRLLLSRYPEYKIDIHGVILDYIGRTGESLYDVFEMNFTIYRDLFTSTDNEGAELLLSSLISPDNETEFKELAERCRSSYPKATELITGKIMSMKLGRRNANNAAFILHDPPEYLGYPVNSIIWQISDVHFGKFNKLEIDPKELACQLAKIQVDHPHMAPDIVLMSGDATSIAEKKEFTDFQTFCERLGTELWGTHRPECLLVVPGNHDVTWKRGGKADHLARFQELVAQKAFCITPFGPNSESFANGNVIVSRCDPEPGVVPPYARVTYLDHDIEFVLLVSAYFSGEVPEETRKLLRNVNDKEQALHDLLRIDKGAISRQYLYNLAKLPKKVAGLRIAVTHHNPIQYGIEPCTNPFAPQMLETLYDADVAVLLHGHVHLIEDQCSPRLAVQKQAYPLPCTSLCSHCITGNQGLSIHLTGLNQDCIHMDTLLWQISASSAFKEEGVSLYSRMTIRDMQLHVQRL